MNVQKKIGTDFCGIFKGKLLRCKEVFLYVSGVVCRFIAVRTCSIFCLNIVINRHSPVALHVIGDL